MAPLKMHASVRTVRTPTPLAAVVWVALLAGCTAGPDFRPPAPPGSAALLAAAQPLHTAPGGAAPGQAQRWAADMDMAAPWWHRFGSPPLDALIDQALVASPTLTAAEATLRQAQEMRAAQAGATQLPRVDASAGGQRQRMSPSAQGLPGEGRSFSQYSASIGVRYTLDLAGGNRRALEALSARTDYRHYQREGARLNLAASIVATAITQARLAAQIEALQAIVQTQEAQLHITGERLRLGQAAHSEVLALQAQVEQARAGVPLLRQQHQQSSHLLATLAGLAPTAQGLHSFTLNDFTLPAELPLVIPSEWVRLRPDIQGAQALLHAANADYGVAVARLYPQVNLSASLGSQALTTGALLGGAASVWSLIGQITQPVFNPALPAEKRAALAALDAAAANYQGVVLEALRSVADALRALDNDAQALAAQTGADAAAQGSLQSMQRQYALGSASYLQLLIAQQQVQQIRTDLVAAQARRLLGSAALYQAVGAGWAGAPQSSHGS
jgi:NodT family efflux transporter outer membrane factor (OMF) lipoprotein